ncbi:MAG TPA: M42 family peptidase [bacterium (Candidatus Stahlbacteria)]|nr:M42 family peptidase [Candidatus Stahlbacteria bacterium]
MKFRGSSIEYAMELKDLTLAQGVSGCEDEVRELIRADVQDYVDELFEDSLGNLIAIRGRGNRTIMLGAHLDEIGLMIVCIEKDGFLRFRPVGGIDQRVLLTKRVRIGEGQIPGVIGALPPHLDKDQNKVVDLKTMYIDIGSTSKKASEKLVSVGDYAVFDMGYYEDNSKIFAKALDDRVGCFILTELIKRDFPGRVAYLFSVQEEVGLRGASIMSDRLTPDVFISVEATGSGDYPDKDSEPGRPRLGEGPAITVTDRSLIVPQDLVDLMVDCAEKRGIPYQFKRPMIGGTDAGRISISREGVKCGVVAVPVRYIHSPIGCVLKKDIEATTKLLVELVHRLLGDK